MSKETKTPEVGFPEKVTKFTVFTKSQLKYANDLAIVRGYNRTLEPVFVASLPDDHIFPVVMTLLHEHAAGVKVDMHVRCWIQTGVESADRVFVDCDMDVFNELGSVTVGDDGTVR